MDLKEFIQAVVTCPTEGYFCLALSNGTGGWLEQWMRYPQDLDAIVQRAEAQADKANCYFSSYLFKAPQSTKDNVLPTRTVQADLDNADASQLPREATILVETSPGRHQAYWILKEAISLEDHEALSKKITYSIPLCDRSGWPLGRKVRLPGTLNHKYLTGPKKVRIVKTTEAIYEASDFEALPEVPLFLIEHFSDTFIENPTPVDRHPRELLEDIKDSIPVKVYVEYDIRQMDRSEALWGLMCYGFKAGLNRNQVFTLARGSANNKFTELKHRADQDLAKDVLRAEHHVNAGSQDPRQLIYDLFKTPLAPIERRRQIFAVVLKTLKDQGEFLRSLDGVTWYIRRDVGRPIPVNATGERLISTLDVQFGLNFTEGEAKYVLHGLCAYASTLPDIAINGALSFYDPRERHMLLHTGRRVVLRITSSKIEQITDGAYHVVFPWSTSIDPFTAVMTDPPIDWADELFGNGQRGYGSSTHNATNMTPSQASALLKVWFLFVLFRNIASSRPILAALGAPGSGKSSLFRKIYLVLYGRRKSIGSVTNVDDFDTSVANDPLHVLDNVDTWERWLPDRIALSAGTSDITKRKLYTDSETVTMHRQAVVGVTAHNPKFGREDVADRFLLFAFKRFGAFVPEETIYEDLMQKRDRLWGAIAQDIQKVLNGPFPTTAETPQFRIEDFARVGLWIARGVGVERDFVTVIESVKSSQQAFSLEEEGLLVNAVAKFATTSGVKSGAPKFYTSSQMWALLETCASDSSAFTRMYRNSVALAKKLSAMQSALSKIVRIEQRQDETGVKTWLIAPKAQPIS